MFIVLQRCLNTATWLLLKNAYLHIDQHIFCVLEKYITSQLIVSN